MTKTHSAILEQTKLIKNNFFRKIKNRKVSLLGMPIRGITVYYLLLLKIC